MADRSVRKRKKKGEEDDEKATEEQTAVGKHLRFNLTTRTSKLGGHKAEYFTGSKAVDFLLDSKWASGEKGTKILFTDRNSVVRYLNDLLYKGMFYRALKVVKKNKQEEEGKKEKIAEKKKEKTKEKEKGKKKKDDKSKDNEKDDGKKEKKGEKRKIRLEPTDDQYFADNNDAYVWVFDPIKPMYYVYGALLVIGAIAVCLFPLWPHWMRIGTYYTSLGGAGLVGSVLVLAVFRLILFCIIWTGTIGKFHFWLFPNLLADVGILESFQPAYICDHMTADKDKDKEDGDDKDEDQAKEGDSENSKNNAPEELKALEDNKDLNVENETEGNIENEDNVDNVEEEEEEEETEKEDGSSKSGSTNGQEGFEFIEQEEISAASEEQAEEDES